MKSLIILILCFGIISVFAQSQWSQWRTSSCYGGIDYRSKATADNFNGYTQYDIQFRNRYKSRIAFDYHITENEEINHLRGRAEVKAGANSWAIMFQLSAGKAWKIQFSGLKVDNGDGTFYLASDYIRCDN